MANASDETRKGQVLRHLQHRANKWVDGPALANEQVGGSEGLKRLRELRAEGHRIITRAHPDPNRDIFQYKLVPPEIIAPVVQERLSDLLAAETVKPAAEAETPPPQLPSMVTPGMAGREMPMKYEGGEYVLAFEVCVDCGGPYKGSDVEHQQSDGRHLRWLAQQRQAEIEQQRIALDPQPPAYSYTKLPDKIVVGETYPCPRCHGYFRPRRKNKHGEWMEVENYARDPYKKAKGGEPQPCIRCNGFGVVPTAGVAQA